MTLEQVFKLIDAGYTKQEIAAFEGQAAAEAPETQPAVSPVKEPEVKTPEKIGKTDIEQASAFDKMLQGITGQLQALTSAVQANNIRGANAPANVPETTEDIIKGMFEKQ